jgi:hypothetical protein
LDYKYGAGLDSFGERWDEYDDIVDDPVPRQIPAGEVLRGVLRADLVSASPEAMNDALAEMLGSMSAAEGFNFGQALQQVSAGATKALQDPTVNSVLKTAVPVVVGAAGAYFGGAAGYQAGSNLGNHLVNALPGPPQPRPAAPAVPSAPVMIPAVPPPAPIPRSPAPVPVAGAGVPGPVPPVVDGGSGPAPPPVAGAGVPGPVPPAVAGGSAAAAQGLVLTQQPEVLRALLSLAVGQAGRPTINGIPVTQYMNLLSDVFGKAAAHADELMYAAGEGGGGYSESETIDQVGAGDSAQVYITLMDANAMELSEALAGGEL